MSEKGFTRKELVDEAELVAASHFPGRTQDIAYEIMSVLQRAPPMYINDYEGEQ